MNWVGGNKRRIKNKQTQEAKQREYFERNRPKQDNPRGRRRQAVSNSLDFQSLKRKIDFRKSSGLSHGSGVDYIANPVQVNTHSKDNVYTVCFVFFLMFCSTLLLICLFICLILVHALKKLLVIASC